MDSEAGSLNKIKRIFYSCGCSLIALDPDFDRKIEAFCLKCGNVFALFEDEDSLVSEKEAEPELLPTEEVKEEDPEIAENLPFVPKIALPSEPEVPEEPENCLHCSGQGRIKVYVQEWDRVRCHNAPCPACQRKQWQEWSGNKWIVDEINLK